VAVGEMAERYMSRYMVDLKVNRLHVDEIWSYVGKHQKRVADFESDKYIGDQYAFVAMDSETKLVPCFRLSKRTGEAANAFMLELSARIVTRFQLSTDAFPPYENAVDEAWGADIDYGQVQKEFVSPPAKEASRRYTPGQIIRVTKRAVTGNPKRKYISTSHIERQNLSMRVSMRRLTRLTNAYSKKWENLRAALNLYFWWYNFGRVHEALRVTPAMEAGISKRIMTWNDLLNWQEQRIAA